MIQAPVRGPRVLQCATTQKHGADGSDGEAGMKDSDPVSPYLKRRLRSVEEAEKDILTNGNFKRIILQAVAESRASGRKPARQFQDAVAALMAARPDLPEAAAVTAVHRTMQSDAAQDEES